MTLPEAAPVQGDAGGVHALGSSLGTHASSASGQASDFARASAVLPVGAFTGLAGDQTRAYLSGMHRAATALAEAYQAVARYLPKVADAIHQAQQDQRTMQEAQRALGTAKQRLADAQKAVHDAQAAVDMAKNPFFPTLPGSKAASAPASNPLSFPLAGPPAGPTPAQLGALAHAKHEEAQAQHQVEEDTHRFQAAQRRFQEAEQHRKSVLAGFVALCKKEAEVVGMDIPQPPTPFLSTFPLFDPAASLRGQLDGGVLALAELPVLANTGFLVSHIPQVTSAVRRMDVTDLGLWTVSSVREYIQAHKPLPPPPAHHSWFSIYTAERLGGDALHYAGDGLAWFGKHAVQDLGYAWDAVKSGATGTWFALTHPAADVDTIEWAVHHPTDFASKALDIEDLEHNPEKWASQLIPVLATVAVTKGLGAGETAAADGSTSAFSRGVETISRAGDEPNLNQAIHLGNQGIADLRTAARLKTLSGVAGKAKAGVEYYDGLSSRSGLATTHQNEGGSGRDLLVGKVVEKATDDEPKKAPEHVPVR